jgi:tetratricopeptide (TPR) repeat protein
VRIRPIRWIPVLLALVACLAWAPPCAADEKSDFEKGRIAYVKKDYVEANARFQAMLDPKTGTVRSPELLVEADMCWGAVKLAMNDNDAAASLFEKVLRADPQYQPDPLTYPNEVLYFFSDTKAKLRAVLEQEAAARAAADAKRHKEEAAEKARLKARLAELEGLASEETVTIKNSRLKAALPFGVGQFANGNNGLGWAFLLGEGALTLSTFVLFIPYRYNVDHANAAMQQTQLSLAGRIQLSNEYALTAQDIRTADFIILGGLGAIMLTGIIEAQVNFVAERSYTRPRTLPEDKPAKTSLRVRPSFAPLPGEGGTIGGAAVGIVGTF